VGFCNLKLRYLYLLMQTDLKRLLRNPPLVKVPKITDLISVHPLLGALPSMVRKALEGSAKEIMKPCGVPLYKEGSEPNGVWLISNGVVKVNKSLYGKFGIWGISQNTTLGFLVNKFITIHKLKLLFGSGQARKLGAGTHCIQLLHMGAHWACMNC